MSATSTPNVFDRLAKHYESCQQCGGIFTCDEGAAILTDAGFDVGVIDVVDLGPDSEGGEA